MDPAAHSGGRCTPRTCPGPNQSHRERSPRPTYHIPPAMPSQAASGQSSCSVGDGDRRHCSFFRLLCFRVYRIMSSFTPRRLKGPMLLGQRARDRRAAAAMRHGAGMPGCDCGGTKDSDHHRLSSRNGEIQSLDGTTCGNPSADVTVPKRHAVSNGRRWGPKSPSMDACIGTLPGMLSLDGKELDHELRVRAIPQGNYPSLEAGSPSVPPLQDLVRAVVQENVVLPFHLARVRKTRAGTGGRRGVQERESRHSSRRLVSNTETEGESQCPPRGRHGGPIIDSMSDATPDVRQSKEDT